MHQKLLITSIPFLALGLLAVAVGLFAAPLTTLVSNEQKTIKAPVVADFYFTVFWPLQLSAGQEVEFQYTTAQSVSFYVMDKATYDQWQQNQTVTPLLSAPDETGGVHTYTPTQADKYYFIIQNTSSGIATVVVTIKEQFVELVWVGVAVIVFGGVLSILGFVLGPKMVNGDKVLAIVQSRGPIWIVDIASILGTSRTDVELCIMKLRQRGVPIMIDAVTGNVSYGWYPPPPVTTQGSTPPAQPKPQS